jgi:hypothetical protein
MKWALLFFVMTLALVDCSPNDGTKKDVHPDTNLKKAVEPEKLGWSPAKLAEARNCLGRSVQLSHGQHLHLWECHVNLSLVPGILNFNLQSFLSNYSKTPIGRAKPSNFEKSPGSF